MNQTSDKHRCQLTDLNRRLSHCGKANPHAGNGGIIKTDQREGSCLGASLIAKNLKSLRKAKGMSQDELAQKAYMSQETVSRYERGRCGLTVENAVVFAQALGVSVADILKGTL